MKEKTFSLISLGCFRNTSDSEGIIGQLSSRGYKFVANPANKKIDLLIINTCGFIEPAKAESLALMRQAVTAKTSGQVNELWVIGCLVQRYKRQLKKEFPQVDQWQGISELPLDRFHPPKLTPRHLAFLKICEGCLHNCSYCAIALIKGPLRSKLPEEIISAAQTYSRQGIKELNIIGQDIASWGKDLPGDKSLVELLKRILQSTNIPWIRLIYTHPGYVSDDLLDLIAQQPRICRYIDLPIQHINDKILKAMNRGITRRAIESLIDKIRTKIPGCVLRTSIIAGFPGERQKDFQELLKFLAAVKFEHLGVFAFSREEGTKAYSLPGQLTRAAINQRREQIMTLQKEIAAKLNRRFVGKQLTVLVEQKEGDGFVGRSQYDAYEVDGMVYLPGKKGITPGKFYSAKIIDADDYDLSGV